MTESRQELFDRMLRENGPALRRLAASRERDPGLAEDLLQDICLAFWRALPRFRGDASPRTYLFRIARNRALSHAMRRARREDDPPTGELVERAVTTQAGPEERLIAIRRRERLAAALRDLKPAWRDVVELRLEGLSHREIGDVLGLTENNVAVRLTRAKQALRGKLDGPRGGLE